MLTISRLPLSLFCLLAVLIAACSDSNVTHHDTVPKPADMEISYRDHIEPIIEAKCLACHGCYDAPCQLKFETPEALIRGAHSDPVYNGARLKSMAPTRLGIDAHTEGEWRNKGFYSVLQAQNEQQPVLMRMLELGKQNEFEPNSRLPKKIKLGLERNNVCGGDTGFEKYARKHPLEGMPLGTTGLNDNEYALFSAWVNQGANVEPRDIKLNQAETNAIAQWEAWLNRPEKEQQLVARWVYEHLFLAHLHFTDIALSENYFELVRSRTPSGEPIEIIPTVRPNDDPKGPVYYRLRVMDETIVHKRHITYPVSQERLARFDELFFGEPWELDALPGYSAEERANPFTTFEAVPARARYQVMLDNAEYFTRTFIRGPVCRGQIATDVIRDHFWAFFVSPDKDAFVTDAEHQHQAAPLLGLAGQNDKLTQAGKEWRAYRNDRNRYLALREQSYQKLQPKGPSLDDVWDGDGDNQDALLTIFRHHDNASVQRGWIGAVPTTIWWMDYPLFERAYYQLVVNFDVFGNVAHQLQTRLYFDLIRNGAEQSFLRLMPTEHRQNVLDSWYQKLGKIKLAISYQSIDTEFPSAETFSTEDPKHELAERGLTRFAHLNAMEHDFLNRCSGNECGRKDAAPWLVEVDRQLATITNIPFEELEGLKHLPENTFLRVTRKGERTMYTIIRNRHHTNVAFLMGEKRRHKPKNDTLTLYPGIIGSYPNFIFSVEANEIEWFIDALTEAESKKDFEEVVQKWGIRRTHPGFWEILADITAWHKVQDPLQAGIFDINRYENL